MKMSENITVQRAEVLKPKPTDISSLGFGKYYTDHMFIMNYDKGVGWHTPRILPYGPLSLDPAAMCLHYGQEVFEGLKAYRTPGNKVVLFRPDKNMARLNLSNKRLCIPEIDEEFAVEAIKQLVFIEKDWIPDGEGNSLYIRPFIIATEPHIGVHPAEQLLFIVILSPVGAYYPEGINPVKIYVEREYVRSVRGGMGYVKTAGNYAASLKAQDEADSEGYTQVLWLDGVERKYIEEVGTMNVFFKINGEIITPALQGSILGGITRLSCIELLRSWGHTVIERQLALEEVEQAAANGTLEEAFGTGTAAVISPIGELKVDNRRIIINNNKIGQVAHRLYDTLTGIQNGLLDDKFSWITEVADRV